MEPFITYSECPGEVFDEFDYYYDEVIKGETPSQIENWHPNHSNAPNRC
jgi:hypothetical protein